MRTTLIALLMTLATQVDQCSVGAAALAAKLVV